MFPRGGVFQRARIWAPLLGQNPMSTPLPLNHSVGHLRQNWPKPAKHLVGIGHNFQNLLRNLPMCRVRPHVFRFRPNSTDHPTGFGVKSAEFGPESANCGPPGRQPSVAIAVGKHCGLPHSRAGIALLRLSLGDAKSRNGGPMEIDQVVVLQPVVLTQALVAASERTPLAPRLVA